MLSPYERAVLLRVPFVRLSALVASPVRVGGRNRHKGTKTQRSTKSDVPLRECRTDENPFVRLSAFVPLWQARFATQILKNKERSKP